MGAGHQDGAEARAGGAAQALDRPGDRDRGDERTLAVEHRRRHRRDARLALPHRLRPSASPDLRERALDGDSLGIQTVDHPLIALKADLAAEPAQDVV